MAGSTQIITQGRRWTVEPTVHADRRNIFAFDGEHGAYHVATLVSGSKSKLDRFEDDGALIAKAPEMARLIADIEEALTADDSYAMLREHCRKLLIATKHPVAA